MFVKLHFLHKMDPPTKGGYTYVAIDSIARISNASDTNHSVVYFKEEGQTHHYWESPEEIIRLILGKDL